MRKAFQFITRPTLYLILMLSLMMYIGLNTNLGLQIGYRLLQKTVPGQVHLAQIEGNLLSGFTIQALVYLPDPASTLPLKTLKIQSLSITPLLPALFKHQLWLPYIQVKGAEIQLNDYPQDPIYIHQLEAELKYALIKSKLLRLAIHQLEGQSHKTPFYGYTTLTQSEEGLLWETTALQWGDRVAYFIPQTRMTTPADRLQVQAGQLFLKMGQHQAMLKLPFSYRIQGDLKETQLRIRDIPSTLLTPLLPTGIQLNTSLDAVLRYVGSAPNGSFWEGLLQFQPGRFQIADSPYSSLQLRYETGFIKARLSQGDKRQVEGEFIGCRLYLPSQGIALESGLLRVYYHANPGKSPQFLAKGRAKIGDSWVSMDSHDPNHWFISGQSIPIYQTYALKARASGRLGLFFESSALRVSGQLRIDQARIRLREHSNQSVISQDVRFIDRHPGQSDGVFRIRPDIQVSLDNIFLQGYGLEGVLGGQLHVQDRHDYLLTGEGKLRIQKGRYRLQGKTRDISKGNLFFPQGTLLSDPVLDIQIVEKNPLRQSTGQESNFYVKGSLTRPIIQAYNPRSQSVSLANQLKDGQAGTSAYSETAVMVANSASFQEESILSQLQDRFHLSEIQFTTRQSSYNPKNGADIDTLITVGTYLSPSLYLQYSQSLQAATNSLKLKYLLGSYWSIGIDSSTEGQGLDFSFLKDVD